MEENRTDVEQGVVLVSNGEPTDVTTLTKAIPAVDNPVFNLTITNLTYKVTKTTGKTAETKVLLNEVSAIARHGEITAIVGPSGAGKSTFLDAIAGRIRASSLEGEILVNGKPVEEGFKRLSGYVMQDDQLFPMLTVRETLMFSARLRLPGSMSLEEKRERVEMLIDELGLQTCADTMIGNEQVRGVSGGERRRVSIGVDLIHDPAVLFLDEPTSGLDSSAALNVMQNLNSIAQHRGRTIVLTIHQPSFRILELVHSFIILARGNCVYHGPYPGMMKFFADYGREVPEHVNALEYALDLIEEEQRKDGGLQALVEFSASKHDHKSLANPSSLGAMEAIQHRDFANGIVSETITLSDRTLRNIFRTPELFFAKIGLYMVVGIVLGTLFLRSGYDTKGISNRASFFSFALALLYFTSFEALPIFLEERQIYIRETSRGAYRTVSYVLGGALIQLPFIFVLSCIFSIITYFLVGLVPDVTAFFRFVSVIFLTLCVANSYVAFFAAFVPNFMVGNSILSALTAFFFLFSGFFITKDNIPKYWIWFYYLSIFKYPLQMLFVNEFGSQPNQCWYISENVPCASSQQVLAQFSLQGETYWVPAVVMVAFALGYRILFYAMLKLKTSNLRS